MDKEIINNTIKELEEKQELTMENIIDLASLYVVADHFTNTPVTDELSDILPAYSKYVEVKTKYQMDKISEGEVIRCMKLLCEEITEFLFILYKCTDMNKERKLLKDMITEVFKHYAT